MTNERNTKSKAFKKARCRCYKSNYNVFIYYQVFFILVYTYSLDQDKIVLNDNKHITVNNNYLQL